MSIPELRKANSGVWYIHWTEGRRSKRVSTRQKDLASAKLFLGEWLLLDRGRPAKNEASKTAGCVATVADMWDRYDKGHVQRHTASPATSDYCWKNLEPHFGALTAVEITQDVVDSYIAKRSSGRIGRPSGAPTSRKELIRLRAALSWNASPERGQKQLLNPAQIPRFALPDKGQPRERWLRTDELKAMFAAARRMRRGDRMSRGERFLWLALETAARKEAILDLTWDRVDFETGTIHYNVPGRRLTKKRRVSVAISKTLRPILERAYAERVNDLVMDNKSAVWTIIQLIAINAGLGGSQEKPKHRQKPHATGISPHTLRHTAATWMARRGVPLWQIANILGDSVAMVEQVYAKWCPDDPARTVDLISAGTLSPGLEAEKR